MDQQLSFADGEFNSKRQPVSPENHAMFGMTRLAAIEAPKPK